MSGFWRDLSRVTVVDFPAAVLIQLGQVPNWAVERKFGLAPDIGTTPATIYSENDLYQWPTAAATLTVSSDDANDTLAGTGAQTVELFGLDTNYDEIDELVELDGTNPVNTVNQYLRVFRGIVRSDGTFGVSNVGNIYAGTGVVTAGKPAVVLMGILPEEGQSLQAIFTVPNANIGFIETLYFSVDSTRTFVGGLYVRPLGEVFQVKQKIALGAGAPEVNMDYIRVEPKSDVELRGFVSQAGGIVSASFNMFLRVDPNG